VRSVAVARAVALLWRDVPVRGLRERTSEGSPELALTVDEVRRHEQGETSGLAGSRATVSPDDTAIGWGGSRPSAVAVLCGAERSRSWCPGERREPGLGRACSPGGL